MNLPFRFCIPLCLWFIAQTDQAGANEVVGLSLGEASEYGSRTVLINEPTSIILFGSGFTLETRVTFTTTFANFNAPCNDMDHIALPETWILHRQDVAEIEITFQQANQKYYLCMKETEASAWIHQGHDSWMQIDTVSKLMPLWLQILLICFLLSLSGLFAGLNLGLMSLDKNELMVIASSGSDSERMYAKAIQPIRKKGNYLLCTILLSNVMINSTLTVLLDQLTTGLIAIITSTLSIVIFADIIPQAICSRHGLAIGAKTLIISQFFMLITFPLSYPISKILDWTLGEEIGQVYDRQKLMEFIKVTKDYSHLAPDEVNMITGALNLKTKMAGEVMTRLEDVFMLSIQTIVDFETVATIQKKGYSRIPIYDGDRKNVVALFHAKDLCFVDPNDNMPIRTLIEFYRHPILYTLEHTPLHEVLDMFKTGKSHLTFVRETYEQDNGDPLYEITGIVTLEDVIEEILQAEIVDETDTLSDNRRKKRRMIPDKDYTDFLKIGGGLGADTGISPQMALAAFQYMSCTLECFRNPNMSAATLRKLMSQKIYFTIRIQEDDDPHDGSEDRKKKVVSLYKEGDATDCFILIIEGRVKVTVGKERLVFLSGPFTYFGAEALKVFNGEFNSDFIPDYSVDITETTTFIKISRSIYLHAFKANEMENTLKVDDMNSSKLKVDGSDTNAGRHSLIQETINFAEDFKIDITPSLGDENGRLPHNGAIPLLKINSKDPEYYEIPELPDKKPVEKDDESKEEEHGVKLRKQSSTPLYENEESV